MDQCGERGRAIFVDLRQMVDFAAFREEIAWASWVSEKRDRRLRFNEDDMAQPGERLPSRLREIGNAARLKATPTRFRSGGVAVGEDTDAGCRYESARRLKRGAGQRRSTEK